MTEIGGDISYFVSNQINGGHVLPVLLGFGVYAWMLYILSRLSCRPTSVYFSADIWTIIIKFQ